MFVLVEENVTVCVLAEFVRVSAAMTLHWLLLTSLSVYCYSVFVGEKKKKKSVQVEGVVIDQHLHHLSKKLKLADILACLVC